MLRYQFDSDSGEYALAKQQAESYSGNEIESKVKGNLAEIAFQAVCRYSIPLDKWHWHNGKSIRRGEIEYNDHDFTIFGQTVDVKARSRLGNFFSIDQENIGSDLIVLVWIPPSVKDEILEADGAKDLDNVHPSDHDPVIIIGYFSQQDLSPPEVGFAGKGPGISTEVQQLPVEPVNQFPIGATMSDWLVEEDDAQYYPEHIGPGTLHRDRESSPLYPGSLAKRYYSDSSPPDNVVVVECPDEPAGSVFNNETGRYEAKDRVYDPNVAQIGIVDISAFSDDLFVEISSLAWRNLYSLITKPVSEAASIQYVRSNELEQLCGVQNLSQPVEAAPVEEWWEDQ